MSNFLFALWRVTTFPFVIIFKIITFPFQAIYRFHKFINEEPEEHTLSDIFVNLVTEEDVRRTFWDDVLALRKHLFRVIGVFALCCLVSLKYISFVLDFLQAPLKNLTDSRLRVSGPGNIFDIIPTVTFSSALILTIPYILFEIWLYASPGLRPIERKLGLALVIIFPVLSSIVMAVGYYLLLPFSISAAIIMTSQFGVYDWELSGYLSFTVKIMMLSAIIVYYPFAIYLYSVLYQKPQIPLRLIVLISYFLAAIITPGTMILIDLGLTVVLSLIYIPTYLALTFLYKSQKREDDQVSTDNI